ncbi:G-protein coupled receptor GRL101-like isoform X3 [Corticium candelabrum]|uniref:G-protein coupled receptor GRL101-like isoform X3 n=1 Tax=Corticium candelabrum TaxID=121492 RepID=UPI002E25B542|nr:G-protein coupled receptor GRL101-like isoform X3 [Corticium candelabrum]
MQTFPTGTVYFDYMYEYEPSGDVLASDLFHAVVWMLLSIGIIGNVLVVVWRLAQKRDQRSSPLSILIIMLAISDFLYCVHLILLESLMTESHLGQQRLWEQVSTRYVCSTSSVLSWFSCLTAQWTTFNIAVYSLQAMSGCCSRFCCSLVRTRILYAFLVCTT